MVAVEVGDEVEFDDRVLRAVLGAALLVLDCDLVVADCFRRLVSVQEEDLVFHCFGWKSTKTTIL